MTSSTSLQNGLNIQTSPMLSRSSSTSCHSSKHSTRRTTQPPYHHHSYSSSSEYHPYASEHHRAALQHREHHPQRPISLPPPLTTPSAFAAHDPYYATAHPATQTQLAQQQFPPLSLSATAAADWDHASQQHLYKRTRYDDVSSSSSTTSSNPLYQDTRSRQPYDAHHRIPSNHSQTSSKGKARETLPSISPIRHEAIPMAISASLPPINGVSTPSHRIVPSPSLISRSADTSPVNRVELATTIHSASAMTNSDSRQPASTDLPLGQETSSLSSRVNGVAAPLDAPVSPSLRSSLSLPQSRHKLVLDYASTDPDPEELLKASEALPHSVVTQLTKGAHAYFDFLQGIARMPQGQAMAHALAAVAACHQVSDTLRVHQVEKGRNGSKTPPDQSRMSLEELANRHHLSAIKALQTQQQPSRRRRFSIIETNSNSSADELPPGSNAATMMLLILACSSIGKSLMLPSYFNQCEQFLADAVEHVSTHRLFPSTTGEAIVGTPEDPPIFLPDNLTNYGGLLFLGTVVGLYECYLSQFTAITDWDYNPTRLKRLLPFNWSQSDAEVFDKVRKSVSETTFSVSTVTLELVIETLDTMRRLRRAEAVAYGNRTSSRSEAEDGAAALDSLALREELGLVIRDLEAGSFWKGAARTLSEADQRSVLESVSGQTADGIENESSNGKDGDSASEPITKAFKSGALFLPSTTGEQKLVVNRLRLANHLYRNALLVDLYVTVFNRPATSLAIRELVSRSITLLGAVPFKLEQGLMWPAVVLGAYAQNENERNHVRSFLQCSQWKGTAGPSTASDVLERVWAEECSWRDSVSYFGSPYFS